MDVVCTVVGLMDPVADLPQEAPHQMDTEIVMTATARTLMVIEDMVVMVMVVAVMEAKTDMAMIIHATLHLTVKDTHPQIVRDTHPLHVNVSLSEAMDHHQTDMQQTDLEVILNVHLLNDQPLPQLTAVMDLIELTQQPLLIVTAAQRGPTHQQNVPAVLVVVMIAMHPQPTVIAQEEEQQPVVIVAMRLVIVLTQQQREGMATVPHLHLLTVLTILHIQVTGIGLTLLLGKEVLQAMGQQNVAPMLHLLVTLLEEEAAIGER